MAYVIRKNDAPVTIMFDDVAYDVEIEDYRINALPLSGKVFKRDNTEVHKFLKYLTQGTKSWKWIENSKGGRYNMKALREDYNVSDDGKRRMNTTKADMKELEFKCQDIFSIQKWCE